MFEAVIEDFRIVPYVRMTRRGKFCRKRAIRYIQNQDQLALLIRLAGKGEVRYPCMLYVEIRQVGLRSNSDWDNYAKAVCDALVKAGVLPDDCFKYIAGAVVKLRRAKRNLVKIKLFGGER